MRTFIIAACLIAGFGAAYTITASAGSPVTLQDLPGLGYSLGLRGEPVGGVYCNNYYVLSGNGAPETLIGDLPPVCSTADQEAGRIAGLLRDFPPPGAVPVVSTVTTTVTALVTLPAVTLPAVTVTEPAVTLPGVTVASPPVVQTVTETVTVPAAVDAPLDPPWLVALQVRSVAMNDTYGLSA